MAHKAKRRGFYIVRPVPNVEWSFMLGADGLLTGRSSRTMTNESQRNAQRMLLRMEGAAQTVNDAESWKRLQGLTDWVPEQPGTGITVCVTIEPDGSLASIEFRPNQKGQDPSAAALMMAHKMVEAMRQAMYAEYWSKAHRGLAALEASWQWTKPDGRPPEEVEPQYIPEPLPGPKPGSLAEALLAKNRENTKHQQEEQ